MGGPVPWTNLKGAITANGSKWNGGTSETAL
jgi:hypothetical protein